MEFRGEALKDSSVFASVSGRSLAPSHIDRVVKRATAVKHLYTLLFSLSIILINPWGTMRGEIWTQPKVFVILLICILNFLILWEERQNLKIPHSWKISRLLWEIFLGIGLISTLTSPWTWRSLLGQERYHSVV